jgi:short-subunit dehydrogenase
MSDTPRVAYSFRMATALITGGTSGLGAEFARTLARRGYDLVLVARTLERLDSTADDLRTRFGVDVETFPADLSDRADVARVVDRITDDARPIELLVNNAGFGVHTPLTSEDTSKHDLAIEVMMRTVLVLGGAAGRAMRARGHGAIINTSSVAGFMAMGSYSAAKAWVTSYSEGLAVELHGTGVRVTALCPGWVRTEFHDRAGITTSSIPDALWIDAGLTIEAGLRASDRGRVIVIPSARFKFLFFYVRYLPRSVIRAISGKISASRRDSVESNA